MRSYENTLALVTKGMLMNSYDLSVTDVTWVIVNKEHVGFKLPPNIKVEFVEGQRKLEDLLVEGKVDAEVEPDLPQSWIRDEGSIERLFPEFEKEEKEYYQRTKVFPIMHPIVSRKKSSTAIPGWPPASTKHSWRHAKRTTSLWSNRTGSVLPGHARIWKKNGSFSVKTLFIRASEKTITTCRI